MKLIRFGIVISTFFSLSELNNHLHRSWNMSACLIYMCSSSYRTHQTGIVRPGTSIESQMVSYKHEINSGFSGFWLQTQPPSGAASPHVFVIWFCRQSQANQHSHFTWKPLPPCFLHVYHHVYSLASGILFGFHNLLPWEHTLLEVNEVNESAQG